MDLSISTLFIKKNKTLIYDKREIQGENTHLDNVSTFTHVLIEMPLMDTTSRKRTKNEIDETDERKRRRKHLC